MNWAEVPALPRGPAHDGRWLPLLLGTAPLLVAIGDLTSPRGWVLGFALPIVLANLGIVLVAQRRLDLVAVTAPIALAALAVALGGEAGLKVAAVSVLGTVLWSFALVPGLEDHVPRAARRPTTLLTAAGSIALVITPGIQIGATVLAVAFAVALLTLVAPSSFAQAGERLEPAAAVARRAGRRLDVALRGVGRFLGRLIAVLAMLPAALVIMIMWLVHRLVRYDPVASPTARPGDWVVRSGTDPVPERLYSGAPLADRRTPAARASGVAATFLVLAIVLLGALVVIRRPDSSSEPPLASTEEPASTSGPDAPDDCPEPPADPVLSDQPQYRQLACERSIVFSRAEYRASTGFRLGDFAGEVINLEDGVRSNWRPPECRCTRLRVWWLGGSAAWGEGQRDLQSLPSMLARSAWDAGIALEIENRAMPTYTFNQEIHLLAELTTTQDPPDLVISYGGGNDLVFQALRQSQGAGEDDSDLVLLEQTFDDLLRNGIPVEPGRVEWTPTPNEIDAVFPAELAEELAALTVGRYARNLGLAERLAESIDTRFVAVWQPLLAGSSPQAGPPDAVPPGLLATFRIMQTAGARTTARPGDRSR